MSDQEANSIGDFQDRMEAIQNEAKSYGIDSIVALYLTDHLSDSTTTAYICKGALFSGIGICEVMKKDWTQRILNS